jgi:hypothetical protein
VQVLLLPPREELWTKKKKFTKIGVTGFMSEYPMNEYTPALPIWMLPVGIILAFIILASPFIIGGLVYHFLNFICYTIPWWILHIKRKLGMTRK